MDRDRLRGQTERQENVPRMKAVTISEAFRQNALSMLLIALAKTKPGCNGVAISNQGGGTAWRITQGR